MNYPHIVVRLMPAIYMPYKIWFGSASCYKGQNAFYIDVDLEKDLQGNLTKRCIDALVPKILLLSQKNNQRMCLVLEKDHCIYLEPDGSFDYSGEPPRSSIA
ncbi:MAG: hypothetical protein AB8G05_05585 [Oligoflexales bacterium]